VVVARTRIQTSDRRLARRILREAQALPSVGQRLDLISTRLLGSPYLTGPLIGSATEPEVFVATLAGFDCVTFMETALALAWARDVDEFLDLLREIRYAGGEVSWARRLHYATEWARYQVQRGRLRNLARGEGTALKTKTLGVLEGLGPRQASFRFFPKRKLNSISRRVADGDLILFVSTREGLDVFHTGLLFRDGERVLLRHAARSRGAVVEQELAEFVRANTMPGFIVLRPKNLDRGAAPH
jgi:hypothetical protein